MPYGNQSPLLGSTIDPSLFIQDFSGFAEASRINAAGMMGMVNQVSAGYQEHQKQQKDQKNALKSSAAQIQAASTLFPEMKPMLEGYSAQLNNEEIPISERAAIASQISNVINLGVDQMRYNTDLGFKKQDQQNQNQESAMRQWAFGQEVSAVERQQNAQQLDTKTKATIGPALLQQVIAMAPKGIADQVKAQAGDYSPDEQYQLAASVMSLIPKAERKKAPTVIDVAVPNGTQKMEWDEALADWVPIRTAIAPPDLTSFVAKLEGFQPKAYSDSGQTSIGFGTRAKPGETEISKDEAAKRLNDELSASAKTVDSAIAESGQAFTQNERNALVSFDFNTGAGRSVISRFAGDKSALTAKMAEYNKLDAGDKSPNKGLINRRNAELSLFNTPSTPIGFTPDKSQEASVSDQLAVQRQQQEIQKEETTRQTALANSQNLIQDLVNLKTHKGFTGLFGISMPWESSTPGTNAADASALLNKIKGQSFLQAVQGLRGMGALSDSEGKKLTDAFLGLDPNMSEAAAKKEIDGLIQNITESMNRAQTIGGPAATQAPQQAADPFEAARQRLLSLPKQ